MSAIQNHFEINVSLNGRHLFATAERSCVERRKLNEVAKIIQEKFPKSEGYQIAITEIRCVGVSVPLS